MSICGLTFCLVFARPVQTQPAKEEKVEKSVEKSPEEIKEPTEEEETQEPKKEKEEEVEAEGEGEGAGEGQASIFLSPLRLARKTKMKLVVCHVTLLDGTDFTCEVEVRQRDALTVKSPTSSHFNVVEMGTMK